jgi:hypothetical protein
MSKSVDGEWITPQVSRVWTGANAEGRVALVLETKEFGPIALELDAQKIAILRERLAHAEQLLNQPKGSA